MTPVLAVAALKSLLCSLENHRTIRSEPLTGAALTHSPGPGPHALPPTPSVRLVGAVFLFSLPKAVTGVSPLPGKHYQSLCHVLRCKPYVVFFLQ